MSLPTFPDGWRGPCHVCGTLVTKDNGESALGLIMCKPCKDNFDQLSKRGYSEEDLERMKKAAQELVFEHSSLQWPIIDLLPLFRTEQLEEIRDAMDKILGERKDRGGA